MASPGAEITSVGRALLPFTLKDGKHLNYSDFLPAEALGDSHVRLKLAYKMPLTSMCVEASVQLKMGGRELKSKLMRLDPNMVMCVQIQPPGHWLVSLSGRHKTRGTEEILMRVPIPTRFLHLAAQGDVVQLPEELLTAEAEEVCGPTIRGGTLRDVMWLCAFMELWQLVLDITHVQPDKIYAVGLRFVELNV